MGQSVYLPTSEIGSCDYFIDYVDDNRSLKIIGKNKLETENERTNEAGVPGWIKRNWGLPAQQATSAKVRIQDELSKNNICLVCDGSVINGVAGHGWIVAKKK